MGKLVAMVFAVVIVCSTRAAQAQVPRDLPAIPSGYTLHEWGTHMVIGGITGTAIMLTVPPAIGLMVGFARPGSEYNVPFGISMAAVSIAGMSMGIWGVFEGMRLQQASIPPLRPRARVLPLLGPMIGVTGTF